MLLPRPVVLGVRGSVRRVWKCRCNIEVCLISWLSLLSRARSGKTVLIYGSSPAVVEQCGLLKGCVNMKVKLGAVK